MFTSKLFRVSVDPLGQICVEPRELPTAGPLASHSDPTRRHLFSANDLARVADLPVNIHKVSQPRSSTLSAPLWVEITIYADLISAVLLRNTRNIRVCQLASCDLRSIQTKVIAVRRNHDRSTQEQGS